MCPNFFLGQTNDFTAPFTEFGMLVTCNFEKVEHANVSCENVLPVPDMQDNHHRSSHTDILADPPQPHQLHSGKLGRKFHQTLTGGEFVIRPGEKLVLHADRGGKVRQNKKRHHDQSAVELEQLEIGDQVVIQDPKTSTWSNKGLITDIQDSGRS